MNIGNINDVAQPPPKLLPVPHQVVAEAEPIVEPEIATNDATANNTFFMFFSILFCWALLPAHKKDGSDIQIIDMGY